jgi:hypothetical protein
MLGALGGVTIAAMILSYRNFNPAILGFWILFAAAAGVHIYVL